MQRCVVVVGLARETGEVPVVGYPAEMSRYDPRSRPGETLFGILMLPAIWPGILVYYLFQTDFLRPLTNRLPYVARHIAAWTAVGIYLALLFRFGK